MRVVGGEGRHLLRVSFLGVQELEKLKVEKMRDEKLRQQIRENRSVPHPSLTAAVVSIAALYYNKTTMILCVFRLAGLPC